MPAAPKCQLLNRLDLLSKTGIGIEAASKELAALLRQLVGADAAAIFWLNAQGLPEGFFHEDSKPEVQALFLDEFERLFVGPDEINVFALAKHRGKRVGNLILPPNGYFKSNTFNLLVRPSGHRHTLDLRIEVAGRTRAVVLLFRGRIPFGDADALKLDGLTPYLQRAGAAGHSDSHDHQLLMEGFLLLDMETHSVTMHSHEALTILSQVNLAGTGAFKRLAMDASPFIQQLLTQFKANAGQPAIMEHAVPDGRLQLRATHLLGAARPNPTQVLVTIRLLRQPRLDMLHRLLQTSLSPTQREIALISGIGYARSECLQYIGVSKEALKKHLKAVYATFGVKDWDELHQTLKAPPAQWGRPTLLTEHHPPARHH